MAISERGSSRFASTRAHYERYPFIEGGPRRVEHWSRRLLAALPARPPAGSTLLDVGSGSGEISECFAQWNCEPTLLDVTDAAVRGAHRRTGFPAVQGDALHLPFGDGSFDCGISIGVLHHTEDCRASFVELVRVTRGVVVIMVYGSCSAYRLVYALTWPLRHWVPVEGVERLPRWVLGLVRLTVRLQGRGVMSDYQIRCLLADSLWSPRVSFLKARTVMQWGEELGIRLIYRKWLMFHGHVVAFSCP
jgi:hypothetical protein